MPADGPRVEAAGGVLWRPAGGVGTEGSEGTQGIEVCLVHRTRYDDWSHPKGKLGKDEQPLVGAVREVGEETGQLVHVGPFLAALRYEVRNRATGGRQPKRVRYWAMRAVCGEFHPNEEVDELAWLDVPAARERLTYAHDRPLLAALTETAVGTTTVLLVRHARAGNHSDWPGHDDLRPLDPLGARQAAQLAQVAPFFGVSAVHSAPLVRCVDTVAPLADRLGIPVVREPHLSEDGYARSPRRALRRLREIAACGTHAVLCSQGGAIPELVTALSRQDGVTVDDPGRSRKGSMWALSFRGGRLVAASYYPSLEPAG